MIFLYFLEIAAQILLGLLVVTQIVLPAIFGGKYFPLFRRRDVHEQRVKAEEELERTLEESRIKAVNRRIADIKAKDKDDESN